MVNQFPQAVIVPPFHTYALYKLANTEMHQIHIDLDFQFIVCNRGIGNPDMLQVGEIHIIAAVFRIGKLFNKLLCPV